MRPKNTILLSFLLLTIFLLPISVFAQQSVSSLLKKVQPAVVLITVYDAQGNQAAQGSGFFVSQKGEVVTNWHVINDASSAVVKTATGAMFKVSGIASKDEKKDIAKIILEAKDIKFPFLPLSSTIPKVGDRIFVIGSPFGLESTVSDGLVSAIRTIPDIGNVIQISAPISPGSSGSPVINSNGQVVGVASFQFVKGQNLNFAVSSDDVAALPSVDQVSVTPLLKENTNKINPEVQLQENGWVKVVETFDDVLTGEEQEKYKLKGKNRWLHIKIQFLKPCKATTKIEEVNSARGPYVPGKQATPEEGKVFTISALNGSVNDAFKKGDTKEAERIIDILDRVYPDFIDYLMPRFNCDYRTKVFATFFSSTGGEIEVQEQIPLALLIRSGGDERKTKMLPGETTWVNYHMPDNASSWVVWVPK